MRRASGEPALEIYRKHDEEAPTITAVSNLENLKALKAEAKAARLWNPKLMACPFQ
jgi:hypothetical protein